MKKEEYFCPECSSKMNYVGGLLDWECPNCGLEGSVEYDSINHENYISTGDSEDKPDCCMVCDGPYPNCIIGCEILDC